MRPSGPAIVLMSGFALAGCSEQVIVQATPDVLVTVDALESGDPISTAGVHYLFARPTPLAEEDAARVVRMRYDAQFDCATAAWAPRSQNLILEDGRAVTQSFPDPVMETPTPGSLGESIVQGVCDPVFRASHASRRSLVSIEKDYLKAMGPRSTDR